ncbi:hypothetical protein D8Y20_08525 [Mariprofundus sp. EBB-1]|uniref:hypothetical protein n=1 Tax=Mariprofundus sp. EBB-1 TaxID=2650971 RepID=UPI000F153E04|nr:hypothetical protein [Mariprofundus sp. EBB-1]RLL51723.1 hypothetical protein D8Y20_08525 [Mariprofundus sp. EBB-1]
MNAVLKADNVESPQCVYNEKVATNLAQTLHIPNAAGVLADTSGSTSFASLEIASPGISLPNIRKSWISGAAKLYPDYVAALIVFDILIGNNDRYQNLKVSLFTPHMDIFTAFDHSHALLHPWHEPHKAVELLMSDSLIAKKHTFYGHVSHERLLHWGRRIKETRNYLIKECCEFGRPINTVDVAMQKKLGVALAYRKKRLLHIIADHEDVIRWTT